jgi:hypothetical protein
MTIGVVFAKTGREIQYVVAPTIVLIAHGLN